MNKRIPKKELNLIKGALRRVFARSELRNQAVKLTQVEHHDPARKRVKTWCKCPNCGELTPRSYMVVDHITPVVAINKTLEDMTMDQLVDAIWCEKENLQAICESCHNLKTRDEQAQRRAFKKGKK